MEGYSLANLGYARIHMGDPTTALAHLDAAWRIADETSELRLGLLAGVYRASALLAVDRTDEAASLADRMAEEAARHGMTDLEMNASTVLSEAKRALSDVDGALTASSRALSRYEDLDAVEEGEAEMFAAHAQALASAGRLDEAHEVRRRGRARISATAAAIDDAELTRMFLEIPAVAVLLEE